MQAVMNRKIRKIKVPDNIIVSTAQVNKLTLVTRNKDDFKGIYNSILNIYE